MQMSYMSDIRLGWADTGQSRRPGSYWRVGCHDRGVWHLSRFAGDEEAARLTYISQKCF